MIMVNKEEVFCKKSGPFDLGVYVTPVLYHVSTALESPVSTPRVCQNITTSPLIVHWSTPVLTEADWCQSGVVEALLPKEIKLVLINSSLLTSMVSSFWPHQTDQ